MGANYFFLDIDAITSEEADAIAAEAFDNSALGTEERLPFKQDGRHYEPQTLQAESTSLRIYFAQNPSSEFIEKLKQMFPEAILRISQAENKDWLAEWKKGYVPFELCCGTWVVPSWHEIPKEAQRVIRIDPGMAFGTGTHETTRLAAGFIQDFATGQVAEKSLFDVGTGTGILAFLAELLGFSRILANDIDEEACRVAKENAELNKFLKMEITTRALHEVEEKFDWMVANIIDGVLCDLQIELKSRVKPKGHLLLTGILAERDELFRREFDFSGFAIVERRQLGEWVGYLLQSLEGGRT